MSTADELDPSEFVQRIRQLGEQRDQQDAERVRKLEEEIIQGRSERLARRAERARSLSPEKSNTPQSQRSAADTPRSVYEKIAESPIHTMEPPSAHSPLEDSLQRLTGSPAGVHNDEPKKPTPSAAVAPSRAGTLSWQRRPQSGARRPFSMVATENNAARSPRETPEPTSPDESGISRNQIVQSLGSKDPSWFRQTADRGFGSAAYRRNQEDTLTADVESSGKRQLPGMSRESTEEPEASSPPPDSLRSSSPSRASSVRGSTGWSNRFSTNTSISGGDVESIGKNRSPLPTLDSQKFNLQPSDQSSSIDGGEQPSFGRSIAMSPAQGRISPERTDRPASPTKGLGGFVQSAMLKRNDSVSKRWSAQAPPGISRQNSTASNRGGMGGSNLIGSASIPKLDARPGSLSRDNSMEPTSRPGSSSSNLTITKEFGEKPVSPSKSEFAKPALPYHSRGKSVTAASASTFGEDKPGDSSPPPSPSKRWSPSKSSWLESALNKPDSSKHKLPPPQQPAWMAEINKAKQQRSSVDLGRGGPTNPPADLPFPSPLPSMSTRTKGPPLEEVSVKGIPKEGLPSREAVETSTLPPKVKPTISPPKATSVTTEETYTPEKSTPVKFVEHNSKPPSAHSSPRPLTAASHFSKASPASLSSTTPKPDTPPKKDFRAALKPRQGSTDGGKKEELEFQNVFGKLKRTQTEKYVAPDELKSNILRGKAGLQTTGGPKPSVHRDELKESLIKQKEAMKAKALESGATDERRPSSTSPTPTTPEAIAKRKNLGRSESSNRLPPAKEKDAPTPEAISRQKSLKERPTRALPDKPAQTQPPSQSTEPAKSSKLADRFNPALAGILARGPSPLSGNAQAPRGGSPPGASSSAKPSDSKIEGPGPELTHMTKGRARGPKRRAPAAKKEGTPPVKATPVVSEPLIKSELVLGSTESPQITPDAAVEEPFSTPGVFRTPARDSIKAKPTKPAKSPQLEKKVERSPSPELPRKFPTAGLEQQVHISTVERKEEKPTISDPGIPSNSVSYGSKAESFQSTRGPLPTPSTKPHEDLFVSKSAEEPPFPTRRPLTTPSTKSTADSPASKPMEATPFAARRPLPTPNAKPIETFPTPKATEEGLSSTQRPLPTPGSKVTEDLPVPKTNEESLSSTQLSSPTPAAKPTKNFPTSEPTKESPLNTHQPSPDPVAKPTGNLFSFKPSTDGPFAAPRPLTTPITNPTEKLPVSRSSAEEKPSTTPDVVRETDPIPESEFSSFSVKGATALWGRQPASESLTFKQSKSPIKLPTRADEQAAMENAGLSRAKEPETDPSLQPASSTPKPYPIGLGLGNLSRVVASPAGTRESSPPKPMTSRYPASPPLSAGRPQSEPFGKSLALEKSDSNNLFADFFDEPPITNGELPSHIDAQEILTSSPINLGPSGKIRTLRKQIQEISGDGKLSHVPMQEEHVLFEESMYLCTHDFGNAKGAKVTEVYLWAGNGVPEATIEDAQLFGRNAAKQNHGKFIILRQGKESPNFFEALGGIVITRRGSRPASKQYMLCGRRHMGHIAFDEVELSLKNLCSGFSYIISSNNGAVYLWKGIGCSAEELSGARLIGMDLGSSGELCELDEGSETPAFFKIFPPLDAATSSTKGKGKQSAAIPRSADHWRYKASSDKYRARLFKVEQHQGNAGWGAGTGLQVSSFFAPLLRRPSWQNFHAGATTPTSRPQTPQTPKSPVPPPTTKIIEIAPFCQRDLEPEFVFVLDAFFEIYIIVGALSKTQASAFGTALLFAQEYGILAASVEDRPFVPVTTVVLEGVPRDMKAVFRHWDETLVPAAGLMRGKLGRGKSLRIVGLEKALEATRR
ncbi:hypothetical protein K432DRAFT_403667 [Lepidopterella palustris CBS 459.81]|uniref:DUF4045 domain-containing protein n=1 Tax=Lepidopterella palustris CBS 459.81 TaxID=1314670 RepID=A0A8E2ECL9_9PEZI|nr:hypothetical protein K432DRAFT_403667 [Lepidopterella palustris CBS 459.81]